MGLFGVNKKAKALWPHLSDADAELCWKLKKADHWKEDDIIGEMVTQKRYLALEAGCRMRLWYYTRMKALKIVWQHEDAEAAKIVAPGLVGEIDKDHQQVLLYDLTNTRAGWADGLVHVMPILTACSLSQIVDAIKKIETLAGRHDVMRALLAARPNDTAKIATLCLNASGDMFDVAIACLNDKQRTPTVLAQTVVALLSNEGTIKVKHAFDRLLALGMNVNHDKGVLLTLALKRGSFDYAQKLIDSGFNLPLLGRDVLAELYSQSAPQKAITFLEERLGNAAPKSTAAPANDDGYSLAAPDTLVRTMALPAGGRLTILFNFALAQQIVLQQLPGSTQPTAPAVVPFEKLTGGEALRTAAAVFERLGGDKALIDRALTPPRRLISNKREGQ